MASSITTEDNSMSTTAPAAARTAYATDSNAAADLVAAVRERAGSYAARAAEIEESRGIPPDIVDEFRRIGIFRMLTPRSHGRLEFDLWGSLQVVEESEAAILSKSSLIQSFI
jgi:indole-3-acetate monooxygenase